MTFVFFSDPVFRVRSLPDARGAEAGDAAAAVADAGDRAGDAAESVLPPCPQVDGLCVPPPATGLDPAESWERPTWEWVNKEVTSIAKRLGATEEHAGVFLAKLRNPKAVGNAPLEVVNTWVRALANAVDSGEMDYGNRFAYGGFNLNSALPFAAMNTWSIPSDCNMVTESQPILDAASAPAVDSQFTLSSKLLCLTKELENVFVASVFHGRDINLGDVGGVCPDGHISYDEFPGYKAADKTKYREYFDGKVFPPEPENFGKFPPEALFSATAYVLRSAAYPSFSVNGKGPNKRTLDLIKLLGGKCEKLGDELARKLGSPYGLNSLEYAADKGHYGMYFVFMPWSEAGGHLMLITLNPQFGSTAARAGAAELSIFLKTQADVIRTLSGCDVLPMDRAHPLWRFLGDLGMRYVFFRARKMREADENGERYATMHVRIGRENGRENGPKYGFFGSEKTEEQKEQDRETCRRNGREYGLFGSEKTEEQKEQDRETCRRNGREYGPKYGLFGSEKTEEQKEQDRETCRRNGREYGSKAGEAFCVRNFPTITCPFCGASDVRLTWKVVRTLEGKSVKYAHVRLCSKDGDTKSKSKQIKFGADEWDKFLRGFLDDEQIKKHKEDVSREVQRLDNTC